MDYAELQARWVKVAQDQLLGRKIVAVRYLSDEERKILGWRGRSVVMQLDDGNLVFPSADDEGNGPGALFTNHKKEPVLPVL